MKQVHVLLFVILFVTTVSAQDTMRRDRYSGGMMIHTGYISGNMPSIGYRAKGAPFGLGGVLRFHFFNHLRIGGEGYVSRLAMQHNGSYIRIGWGGLLVDGYYTLGRWTPYGGVTVGGGSSSMLLMKKGNSSDWVAEEEAILHNGSLFIINPFVGCEFSLTRAIRLTLKADYMLPLNTKVVPTGVRVYLGVIFGH